MGHDVTICALFYGDHPKLAARCLQSLHRVARTGRVVFRLGMNECSATTHATVEAFRLTYPSLVTLYDSAENVFKYPLMRQLFHSTPLTTPYVMWFDDDSWIMDTAPDDWLDQVLACFESPKVGICGSIWYRTVSESQRDWMEDQPWSRERPPRKINFVTGGWWTTRTELVQRFDWPLVEISHNGGDVTWCELLCQQGYTMKRFSAHLGINADDTGKCSTAKPRHPHQPMVGHGYVRGTPPAASTAPPRAWTDILAGD